MKKTGTDLSEIKLCIPQDIWNSLLTGRIHLYSIGICYCNSQLKRNPKHVELCYALTRQQLPRSETSGPAHTAATMYAPPDD